MLKTCVVLGTLLLSLAVTVAAQPVPAAGALVTLERGQAYEASWDADRKRWIARVYVTSARNPPKLPIEVSVRSVALGSRTDPRLTGLFQVSPAHVEAATASVDVWVPRDPAVLPAIYQATLVFRNGEESQTADIQLTVPAATLSGPPSLQLTRVLFSPFSVDDPKLQIWEVSGKSPADVRAHQSEPFASLDHQTSGEISLTPKSVLQSGSVDLPYTFTGEFPLGTVSSKITISSDQSPTPLVIPVQVHTRLTQLVLVAIILLGLTLGFLTRTVLKLRIDIGEARKRAADAVAKLTEYAEIHDNTFQSQILKARRELELAVRAATATAATIADAIKAAEDARQAALTDLTSRLKKAEEEINALAEVVTPAWTLPAILADTVIAPRLAIVQARQLTANADADRALTTMRDAQSAFRDTLRSRFESWPGVMTRRLGQFQALLLLVEADRRGVLEKEVQGLQGTLPDLGIAPDADLAGLKAALRTAHGHVTTLRSLVREVADEIDATFTGMNDILSDTSLKDKAQWETVQEATEELLGQLQALDPGSSADWSGVGQHAAELLRSWENALARQKPQAEGVEEAFTAGHYGAAAKALEKALGADVAGEPQGHELPSSITALDFVGRQTRPESWQAGASRSAAGGAGGTGSGTGAGRAEPQSPDIPNEPFEVFVEHSMRELLLAKLTQAMISWVALTLIGYLIFVDKFVGTGGDLLSAFFWGFTTDIGVDGLLAAAKSKQS